ncbi:sulfatase-like hydrolase/transferase [Aliiroseovarius sp. 2305UL8-7]|uniref:sulfatase-like hydrolase/transferase n=1 Tax=Aliiroseovarius conchicola TaxID=3121637 RepID=UPI003527FFFB
MTRRKNIILMTIDDGGAFWRFRDAFGERLQTPNLDRIFASSAAFTSAYCQAPICGPSRNSLMSGLAPHQTGMLDNYINIFTVLRPEQLWQYRLKQSGYYCSTAGKIHHSFAPIPRKFHDILYSHPPNPLKLGPPRDVSTERYGGLTGGGATTDPEDDKLYYDHQSASDAVAFLENYDDDRPFYREVGFHHPHIPLKTPAVFKEIYDVENFTQPPDWDDGFETAEYPDKFMIENMDLRDKDYWRKSVRNYFSAYSHVDRHIGRVWDALQSSPHAKDTIFIFTSDHGYHLGDKNRMRKFTLWEESCRVPLLIHDPSVEALEIDDPVALLDIGPTILDYANCPPLKGAPGRSLVPQVRGTSVPDRAVPTFLFGNSSMRKGRYRITLYQNEESELYDVEADPWQTKNLGRDHPDYARMRAELAQCCAEHGLILPEAKDQAVCGTFYAGFSDADIAPPAGDKGTISGLDHTKIDHAPAAPGHHVHFSTLDHDGTAPLPNAFAKMHYGADTGGKVKSFTVAGNRKDNEFLFPGSFNRFTLTVHPGPGENNVIAQNDDLIVYGGNGDTNIRAGNSSCFLVGGSGRNVFQSGKSHSYLEGGPGDAQLYGGSGYTEMISGAGTNLLVTGTGKTLVKLTGGCNTVHIKSAEVQLNIYRTGLPQTVVGYCGGPVDISDWAALGHTRIETHKTDVVLTCATERVVFKGTNVNDLSQALTGKVET